MACGQESTFHQELADYPATILQLEATLAEALEAQTEAALEDTPVAVPEVLTEEVLVGTLAEVQVEPMD